jgi:hypothetical protein
VNVKAVNRKLAIEIGRSQIANRAFEVVRLERGRPQPRIAFSCRYHSHKETAFHCKLALNSRTLIG